MSELNANGGQAAFALGQTVATPEAMRLLELHGVNVFDLLRRHASGNDWGDICAEDCKANQDALRFGGRVLSAYTLIEGDRSTRLLAITEWDRSVTTVLTPGEY